MSRSDIASLRGLFSGMLLVFFTVVVMLLSDPQPEPKKAHAFCFGGGGISFSGGGGVSVGGLQNAWKKTTQGASNAYNNVRNGATSAYNKSAKYLQNERRKVNNSASSYYHKSASYLQNQRRQAQKTGSRYIHNAQSYVQQRKPNLQQTAASLRKKYHIGQPSGLGNIGRTTGNVWNKTTSGIRSTGNIWNSASSGLGNTTGKIWNNASSGIGNATGSIWNPVKSTGGNIWNKASGGINNTWKETTGGFSNIGSGASNVWNSTTNTGRKIWSSGASDANQVGNWVTQGAEAVKVGNPVKALEKGFDRVGLGGAGKTVSDFGKDTIAGARNFASNPEEALEKGFDRVGLGSAGKTVSDFGKDTVTGARNFASNPEEALEKGFDRVGLGSAGKTVSDFGKDTVAGARNFASNPEEALEKGFDRVGLGSAGKTVSDFGKDTVAGARNFASNPEEALEKGFDRVGLGSAGKTVSDFGKNTIAEGQNVARNPGEAWNKGFERVFGEKPGKVIAQARTEVGNATKPETYQRGFDKNFERVFGTRPGDAVTGGKELIGQGVRGTKHLGGDIARETKHGAGDVVREGKRFAGDIAREGKKGLGDIAREGKKFAGDVAREGKKGLYDIGAAEAAVVEGAGMLGQDLGQLGVDALESTGEAVVGITGPILEGAADFATIPFLPFQQRRERRGLPADDPRYNPDYISDEYVPKEDYQYQPSPKTEHAQSDYEQAKARYEQVNSSPFSSQEDRLEAYNDLQTAEAAYYEAMLQDADRDFADIESRLGKVEKQKESLYNGMKRIEEQLQYENDPDRVESLLKKHEWYVQRFEAYTRAEEDLVARAKQAEQQYKGVPDRLKDSYVESIASDTALQAYQQAIAQGATKEEALAWSQENYQDAKQQVVQDIAKQEQLAQQQQQQSSFELGSRNQHNRSASAGHHSSVSRLASGKQKGFGLAGNGEVHSDEDYSEYNPGQDYTEFGDSPGPSQQSQFDANSAITGVDPGNSAVSEFLDKQGHFDPSKVNQKYGTGNGGSAGSRQDKGDRFGGFDSSDTAPVKPTKSQLLERFAGSLGKGKSITSRPLDRSALTRVDSMHASSIAGSHLASTLTVPPKRFVGKPAITDAGVSAANPGMGSNPGSGLTQTQPPVSPVQGIIGGLQDLLSSAQASNNANSNNNVASNQGPFGPNPTTDSSPGNAYPNPGTGPNANQTGPTVVNPADAEGISHSEESSIFPKEPKRFDRSSLERAVVISSDGVTVVHLPEGFRNETDESKYDKIKFTQLPDRSYNAERYLLDGHVLTKEEMEDRLKTLGVKTKGDFDPTRRDNVIQISDPRGPEYDTGTLFTAKTKYTKPDDIWYPDPLSRESLRTENETGRPVPVEHIVSRNRWDFIGPDRKRHSMTAEYWTILPSEPNANRLEVLVPFGKRTGILTGSDVNPNEPEYPEGPKHLKFPFHPSRPRRPTNRPHATNLAIERRLNERLGHVGANRSRKAIDTVDTALESAGVSPNSSNTKWAQKARVGTNFEKEVGMENDHLQAAMDAADKTGLIGVFRPTKTASLPGIRKGDPPKDKKLSDLGIKCSSETGVATIDLRGPKKEIQVLGAFRQGYYVVDSDGIAKRMVNGKAERLDLRGKADWDLRPGQVIHGKEKRPIVGDYDVLSIIDPKNPGKNVTLHSSNGVKVKNFTSDDVETFLDEFNKGMDRPRSVHGAQDQFDNIPDEGALVVLPGRKAIYLPDRESVIDFYEYLGRRTIRGDYNGGSVQSGPVRDRPMKRALKLLNNN